MWIRRLLSAPDCEYCPLHNEVQVPPEGDPHARIAVVGEGPGTEEIRRGRPFIGRSGDLLTWLLEKAGINRKEIWVSNAGLCMPAFIEVDPAQGFWKTKNQTLKESTTEYCRGRLLHELAQIKPRVVVAVGNAALFSLAGKTRIMARHGALHRVDLAWLAKVEALTPPHFLTADPAVHGAPDLSPGNVTYVLPALHPAHLLRGEARKISGVIEVLRKAKRLSRSEPIPEGRRVLVGPYSGLSNIDEFETLVDEILRVETDIVVDVETTSTDARHAHLTALGIGSGKLDVGVSVIVLAPGLQGLERVWSRGGRARIYEIFRRVWLSRLRKWFWNMNYDVIVINRYWPGDLHEPLADGIHLHWLSQPDLPHNLGWACQTDLDIQAWKEDFHEKQSFESAKVRDLLDYNAQDVINPARLIPLLQERVRACRNSHLVDHQLRVTRLARKATLTGIPVDLGTIKSLREKYELGRQDCLKVMCDAVRGNEQGLNEYLREKRKAKRLKPVSADDFNPQSPDHASWFLYELMKLPVERMTAGGKEKDPTKQRPSYSYKGVLGQLKNPAVAAFVTFSENVYPLRRLDEFEACRDPQTGRIHPPWSTTGQVGPRWRSTEPNMQNLDDSIKDAFRAPSGYVWVGADAAQLEMRIIAAFSGAQKLIEIFNRPQFDEEVEAWKKLDPEWDSHSLVAAMIYGPAFRQADPKTQKKLRFVCKRIVYCMNYGGTAERVHITLLEDRHVPSELRAELTYAEVSRVYDGFKAYFPEIDRWCEAEVARVRRFGYQVIPPFNRYRWWAVRDVEEPKIRNTPIQWAAGDIVNFLFCRMDDEVEQRGLDATMVVHGHDACDWLVRADQAETVRELINRHFHFMLEGPRGPVHIWGQAKIGSTLKEV